MGAKTGIPSEAGLDPLISDSPEPCERRLPLPVASSAWRATYEIRRAPVNGS